MKTPLLLTPILLASSLVPGSHTAGQTPAGQKQPPAATKPAPAEPDSFERSAQTYEQFVAKQPETPQTKKELSEDMRVKPISSPNVPLAEDQEPVDPMKNKYPKSFGEYVTPDGSGVPQDPQTQALLKQFNDPNTTQQQRQAMFYEQLTKRLKPGDSLDFTILNNRSVHVYATNNTNSPYTMSVSTDFAGTNPSFQEVFYANFSADTPVTWSKSVMRQHPFRNENGIGYTLIDGGRERTVGPIDYLTNSAVNSGFTFLLTQKPPLK